MSPNPALIKKAVAAALGGVFLGTQCLFAYQPEKEFWAERRRAAQRGTPPLYVSLPLGGRPGGASALAAQFPSVQSVGASLSLSVSRSVPERFLKDHAALFAALSPAYGTVRKVSLPPHLVPGSPVVIHIQDVHMNQEAQWNIRETVRALLKAGQVDLIGLEGATEEINLQPFVDFPSHRAVEVTADYLLKQNKITGPIHAALTATGTLPKILGIDDPIHYAANVRAYTDSSVRLEKSRQDVIALNEEIEGRKKAVCSQELFEFDEEVRSYQKGEISLGDHVLNLTQKVPKNEAISIHSFKEALGLERTLDFRQVEVERAALISALTQRLNDRETKDLLAQSLAYRAGQMSYAEFYSHLKETCRSKGLPMSRFPGMEAYVRYVLTADGIDGERLLEDIADLEKRAYDRLARSKAEKALVSESRRAWLTEKLVDFSLTPADWKEYQALGPVGTKEELGSFESFYREAQARDGAMAENLLREIGTDASTRTRTAVLVTGGYHAEGMAQRLVHRGAVVVSYVPKIEKIDTAQGSAYLSVFTQEKTPLEKLFAGQKLFLGYNPVAGVPEAVVLTPLVARVENNSSRKMSDGDRAKIDEFLKRFYPDAKLTIGDPEQKKDGGWVVKGRVKVGEKEENFSLEINETFDIKLFRVVSREERPLTSGWIMKLFGDQNILVPVGVFSLTLIIAFVGVSGLLGNVFPFGQHIYEGNFPALAQLFPVFVLGNRKDTEDAEKTDRGRNRLIDFCLLWLGAVNSIFIGFLRAVLGLTPPAGEEKSRIQEEADSNVSGDADTIGNPSLDEHKVGSLQTELLASLPEGVASLRSVRISVKLEVDGEAMYLTLKNKKFKDECPGGGVNEGETLLQAVLRELKEELGDDWEKIDVNLIKISEKPVLYHSITRPNGIVEYRTVHDVEITLDGAQLPPIDNARVIHESETSNWVSYKTMKEKYDGFTLASRKVILARVIDKEYGLKAVFFSPLSDSSGGNEFPLLITNEDGTRYVLRERDKGAPGPEGAIPLIGDADEKEFVFKLGGRNLILIPYVENKNGIQETKPYFPVVEGKMPIMEKNQSTLSRVGIMLVGQWVPSDYMNLALAFVTAAGARVSYLVHRNGNRDWVVDHLPNLSPAQRSVARDVLIALEGRSLRLGVADFHAMIAQLAEKNAKSDQSFSIESDLSSPTVGDGVKFFVVDPLTLEKPGNAERLKNLLIQNRNLIAILPQKAEGFPANQMIVAGNAFSEAPGGAWDVLMSGLRSSIMDCARGRPFQISASPLLHLNTADMAKDDAVRLASETAAIYVLELLRGFSATVFRWPDVLRAFRVLAEAA